MLNDEFVTSIVKYVVSNNTDDKNDTEIYNDWARVTNNIIKEPHDIQYVIELIRDFKKIKQTKLVNLL